MSAESKEKERKVRKSLEEFLSVIMEAKSVQDAAQKLELTESSFTQRLLRERKRYPDVFQVVDTSKFYTGKVGRKPPTKEEAWDALARIKGVSVEDLKKEIQASKEQEPDNNNGNNKESHADQEVEVIVNQEEQKPKRRRSTNKTKG